MIDVYISHMRWNHLYRLSIGSISAFCYKNFFVA